ncbi:aspartate kinase [Helicobacter sp. 16-1353]|uniref:aspartate kinase n=1 Tax=Helicobacter sp. 16-1353 TaxID=2004996 RepID=UPI000DCF535C|nr:aspartate kinase [Helicobacter sp. 16-1353]RAX53199.1 aspartate kinase [Helicobacter sp. 16-1353]
MLIVQKYGGTSVGDCSRIENVAKKIVSVKEQGNSLVVVVSAMSGETDKLLGFATYLNTLPNEREVDKVLSTGEIVTSSLLAIALDKLGYKAVGLSGRAAGIITDTAHTKARIDKVNTEIINNYLKEDYIVVVAGFQGQSIDGHTTTLGRGGSDLSAVALAGALKADLCEIYTDVDGVFTTDPRIDDKARKIDKISYDEMLELASLGAKVLLNRSVELAKKLNVKIITRNSFNDNMGTLITNEEEIMEKPIITGIALDKNQARISIVNVDDKPGIAAELFTSLANANINVDMIVQTIGRDGKTDIDFTIPKTDIALSKRILDDFKHSTQSVEFDEDIAKVSIVGLGMKSHSGVASKTFGTMAKEGINIMMISTSEIKISMIIDLKYAELAVRALHSAYDLDK